MKKIIVFIAFAIIGLVFICGCVKQSNPSSIVSVVTPLPTLKTQFSFNDPATDGNLRITAVNVGGRVKQDILQGTSTKIFQVVLKLENLRSDKSIQILTSDFQLLDENSNVISSYITFGGGESKITLTPNQREQNTLEIYNYDYSTEKGNGRSPKLKFDFSGSGGNTGSSIVYFNL